MLSNTCDERLIANPRVCPIARALRGVIIVFLRKGQRAGAGIHLIRVVNDEIDSTSVVLVAEGAPIQVEAQSLRAGTVRYSAGAEVRAYATDVWYSDPPDASCPLYDAPNVIMTPHLGASTRENMLRIGDVVVRLLEDFAQQTV